MSAKTIHIVSHSHWDREWYMPFQEHRARLVDLLDSLIETLENHQSFRSFHLDGQTIILDDYLEIRPENRERLVNLVRAKRLFVGPWYVLQDEYLTSGESAVRNLMFGLRAARTYGAPTMIGYLPDSFGNISQMPQILRGFGIGAAVFGRGLNRIGSGPSGYHSELRWRSPDGSTVFGVFMANWYNNANEIPADPRQAQVFLERARDNAAAVATTDHVLLMNGGDHEPVQRNLGDVIAAVQRALVDRLIHSNLPDYVSEVSRAAGDLAVHEGEMDSRHTAGWRTLVNTASARIYLKQMNYLGQRTLEREAEPLSVFAWLCGGRYPDAFLQHSWKLLLQNHPHDSICGCSVDEVHDEMVTRFRSSMQLAQIVVQRSAHSLNGQIDTLRFGETAVPVVVWNTLGWTQSQMVEIDVDIDERDALGASVVSDGTYVAPVMLKDRGVVFAYELPDDAFRIAKKVHRYRARFHASAVPSMGYKTFYIIRADDSPPVIANKYLEVRLQNDGSVDLLHRATGRWNRGLMIFEDVGDCGDEYDYRVPDNERRIATTAGSPTIAPLETVQGEIGWSVTHTLQLPAYLVREAPSHRSAETVACTIRCELRLAPDAEALDVKTTVVNTARDHRLRVLFPTGIRADHHFAQGQFDVIRRPNTPWEGWENPSNCQKHETFVAVEGDGAGLLIANRGLPEYEVLPDGEIALTLLRGVDRMDNWGLFWTPGAQCLGEHTFEYSIVPYGGTWLDSNAYREAIAFASPMPAFQSPVSNGTRGDCDSLFAVESGHLIVSATKRADDSTNDMVFRVYNPAETSQQLRLSTSFPVSAVYRASLEERREAALDLSVAGDGTTVFEDSVLPKQIATYLVEVEDGLPA